MYHQHRASENTDRSDMDTLDDIVVFGNRVLVNLLQMQNQTKSGILLTAKTQHYFAAEVLLVGDKVLDMQAGDIIAVDPNLGKDARLTPNKYLVFSNNEGIIARIGKVNDLGEHEIYDNTQL